MPGPDVFAVLTEDHREVEGLFQQFQQANDPEVARKICDELTVHALVEEELVYPFLATKVDPGQAREARHEHEEAKELINQIDAALANGGDIGGLMSQLQQSVQHHVQEEESEIFPKMRERQPDIVAAMGPDVVERKKTLQAQVAETRSLGEPLRAVEADRTPPAN
jgi:hemerythrin superfamily protein